MGVGSVGVAGQRNMGILCLLTEGKETGDGVKHYINPPL